MSKILICNNIIYLNWKIKKIIYNNKNSVDSSTIARVSSFESCYLTKENCYVDRDPLSFIGQIINNKSPVDRTGYLEYYKMSYNSIPIYDNNFNESYSDIALNRARQLWENNDTISVLFDGQFDSIVSCLSLIDTKPNNKKLKIICLESVNDAAVPFFKEFIIKKTNKDFFNAENLIPTDLIVTSNSTGVDLKFIQLISTITDPKKISWKYLILFIKKYLIKNNWEGRQRIDAQNEIKNFNNFLNNHIKQAPFLIQSFNDMLWWLTFAFADNQTNYIVPIKIIDSIKSIKLKKIDLSKWINFFNHDNWQLWHMKNYDSNRDINIFTKETESFIKNFVFLDKLKYKNVNNLDYNLINTSFLILDDGRIIYIDDLTIDVIKEIL